MPFGLKNAPSESQNTMNDIFTPYTNFIIVYIDDVLVISNTIDQHFKHLQTFIFVMERNGLAASASKRLLFQTKIRFLGITFIKERLSPFKEPWHLWINFLMKLKTANNYNDF
uniref:Reverse transcriptase domain-containing protein n=1 Tax=Opuntia streptacantha TaxID=393608 RepID=A0A7C8YX31_OPUST